MVIPENIHISNLETEHIVFVHLRTHTQTLTNTITIHEKSHKFESEHRDV